MDWTTFFTTIAAVATASAVLFGGFAWVIKKIVNVNEYKVKVDQLEQFSDAVDLPKVQEYRGKVDLLEQNVSTINADVPTVHDYRVKVDRLETSTSELTTKTQEHNDRLIQIETAILFGTKSFDVSFGQRHSPRTLNDLGRKIYNMMDGDKFLEDNKETLFALIESSHPKAALDVEMAAKLAIVKSTSEDYFIPIKDFIYNCELIDAGQGKDPIDMDIKIACYVLAFPLRDLYLKEHPNLVERNGSTR